MTTAKDKNIKMTVWNQMCKTDPKYTKPIVGKPYRGTDITPQYTIKKMTEVFGMLGEGWGYSVDYGTLDLYEGNHVLAYADVLVWAVDISNTFGPWRGSELLLRPKGDTVKVDDDAFKKATTDALTKALSHLGCNADVFLGEFDKENAVVKALGTDTEDIDLEDLLK